jgi:NAD-dependent SIR2 family protein deacetylase
MSGWISHDFVCGQCKFRWDTIVKRECQEELQVCPKCETLAGQKTISTPRGLLQKEIYHMGKKRKGFSEMKEAYSLESEMYNQRPEERGEIQKEIDKLTTLPKG